MACTPNGATGVAGVARRQVGRWLHVGRGVKHLLEGVEHGHAVREDSVREQERVEEVDREEAQVRQPFQEPLRRRVPDLRHLRANTRSDDSLAERLQAHIFRHSSVALGIGYTQAVSLLTPDERTEPLLIDGRAKLDWPRLMWTLPTVKR